MHFRRAGTALRAFADAARLLRLVLPKERGHPRDLKRKVEKDRKDRAGD
jgi:hypothetical protein